MTVLKVLVCLFFSFPIPPSICAPQDYGNPDATNQPYLRKDMLTSESAERDKWKKQKVKFHLPILSSHTWPRLNDLKFVSATAIKLSNSQSWFNIYQVKAFKLHIVLHQTHSVNSCVVFAWGKWWVSHESVNDVSGPLFFFFSLYSITSARAYVRAAVHL